MIRLAVRVRREQAELVLAELLSLSPAGVEEVSRADHVEYALYGAPGELPALPDLTAAAGTALVEVSTSELPDDWSERWKSFHRPVLITPATSPEGHAAQTRSDAVTALRVRPTWEPAAQDGLAEIVIDPGQAFGTGAHASTRLCLELLLALALAAPRRGPLLDVGTGSGVLAIAAKRLGFDPVLALDSEPESVAAARENARLNGERIEVRRLDLRSQALPISDAAEEFVVVANLLGPLLCELARRLARAPSQLIAGGLLPEQAEEVAAAFASTLGLRELHRCELQGWAALWLARA